MTVLVVDNAVQARQQPAKPEPRPFDENAVLHRSSVALGVLFGCAAATLLGTIAFMLV